MTAGRGVNTIDAETYAVGPGTFYFTNPAHLKSYRMSEALAGYIAMFDPDFAHAAHGRPLERDFPFLFGDSTPSMQLPDAELAAVRGLYEGLLSVADFPSADTATRTALLGTQLLGTQLLGLLHATGALLRQYAAPAIAPPRDSELFDRFRAELETAMQELLLDARARPSRPSVAGFAERLYVSPDHLSAVVRDVSGLSPKQHVDARVATEAATLLRQSDAPVSAIATRLGFRDASNFVRFVRRSFGESPSALRRATRIPGK